MNLKCAQSVLIVGGGKDNGGHGYIFRRDGTDHIESIHSRHANVEEQERGPGKTHEFDGLVGGSAFAYDFNVRHIAEELTQLLPGQHLVISQYRLNHSAPYLVIVLSASWDS